MNKSILILSIIFIVGCSNHSNSIINHPITPTYLLLKKKSIKINEVLLLNYCNDLFQIESQEKYIDFIKNNKYKVKINEDFPYIPKRYYSDLATIKNIMYHINEINEFNYEYVGYNVFQFNKDTKHYISLVFQSSFLNCIMKKKCVKVIEFKLKDGMYYFNGIDFYPKPENTISESH